LSKGNPDDIDQFHAQNNERQLKRDRFLCQVSSLTTLYVTFCITERQLCDTSTGKARCICSKGWKGSRCEELISEPPSTLPTKMPTLSRVGGICTDSTYCAEANSECIEGRCQCQSGYTSRKGSCININECRERANHGCHQDAQCIDNDGGYDCICKDGFTDVNPSLPGRNCKQTNECSLGTDSCDKATQMCVDRRPPEKWECAERTPAPTPKPTPKPTPSTDPPTMQQVALHSCQGVLDINEK
jgi:Calcium-binding EGF domain/EB module